MFCLNMYSDLLSDGHFIESILTIVKGEDKQF